MSRGTTSTNSSIQHSDATPLDSAPSSTPDFREVGASGRYWTRDEIIAALAADPGSEPLQITQPETTILSDDLVLLTYLATRPTRHTRRASLWRRIDGNWRILHHQGTPVST